MVTIVDPHVKRDSGYYVYKEASEKKYFVRTKDGTEFDGWCWPGACVTHLFGWFQVTLLNQPSAAHLERPTLHRV
jgi:hypothetical protein